MSPVFDCTDPGRRAEAVRKAAAAVREGRLVVLPTDTVYGIGADAFSPDAVRAVLDAKGRGPEMPPPVLIAEARTVDGLATDVPAYARDLMAEFWPGPLTLVLRAQPSLAWDLGDTGGTVALRLPDDELARDLIREVGPMAVSSANRSGHPAARTVAEAASQLGPAVEVYLDGGPTRGGLASTILDCTREEPVILRSGALGEDALTPVLRRSSAGGERQQQPLQWAPPEHEADVHEADVHDSALRDPDMRDPDMRDPDMRDPDMRDPDMHDPDMHDPGILDADMQEGQDR